jgi:hypothetical protein
MGICEPTASLDTEFEAWKLRSERDSLKKGYEYQKACLKKLEKVYDKMRAVLDGIIENWPYEKQAYVSKHSRLKTRPNPAFYVTDPQDTTMWIYFCHDNVVSGEITYAPDIFNEEYELE